MDDSARFSIYESIDTCRMSLRDECFHACLLASPCHRVTVLALLVSAAEGDGTSHGVRSFPRMPQFIHYCHMYRVGYWLFNKR